MRLSARQRRAGLPARRHRRSGESRPPTALAWAGRPASRPGQPAAEPRAIRRCRRLPLQARDERAIGPGRGHERSQTVADPWVTAHKNRQTARQQSLFSSSSVPRRTWLSARKPMMSAGTPACAPDLTGSQTDSASGPDAACAAITAIRPPPNARTPRTGGSADWPGKRAAVTTRRAMPQSGRTFSACGPFCPWVVSNSTFWFSSSDL